MTVFNRRITSMLWVAIVIVATPFSAFAQYSPKSLNISGGLFLPSGLPVTNASVDFRLEIWDKGATCKLYEETHNAQNLSQTKGGFSLQLGEGTAATNFVSGGGDLTWQVFANPGAPNTVVTGCVGGVLLLPGDDRLIRVYYNLGSGMTAMTPDVPIESSAYAMIADTIQGRTLADLIVVRDDVGTDLTQSNVENVFSASNYAKLVQLLTNTLSASYSFNNQTITNVGTPSAGGDAVNKTYADSRLAGNLVNTTGVANGNTLIWNGSAWLVGTPSATDATKLPLAGGTMTGPVTLQMTMLGRYNNAAEAGLGLAAADEGKIFYNTEVDALRVWNGAAFVGFGASGVAGGDLTGTYPNPTINVGTVTTAKIATDAITASKLDNAGMGINRIVVSDGTDPSLLRFKTCALNQILQWGATGWGCVDVGAALPNTGIAAGMYGSSTMVSRIGLNAQGVVTSAANVAIDFPVVSVNGKTGVVVLNGADLGLGTASLEDVGNGANEVPMTDAGGKLNPSVIPTLGIGDISGAITSIVASSPITGGGTSGVVTIGLDASQVDAAMIRGNTILAGVPADNQVLTWNNSAARWEARTPGAGADNLGDHTAAQNIELNGFWLSGDGNDEGVFVDVDGRVGVGTDTPNVNAILDINGLAGMSALLVPRDTQAARPVGVNGMIRYNINTAKMEVFENGGWTDVVQTPDGGILNLSGTNGALVSGPALTKTISIDTGVTAGQIVQVAAGDMLPVIDGSNLTGISNLRGVNVSTTAPTVGQVLRHNGSAWEAFTPVDNAGVTLVAMGSGMLGGNISATGTLTVDVGTGPNQIVQLDGTSRLPAVDGSQLTNVNAVQIQSRDVAAGLPADNQVLTWNNAAARWEARTPGAGADNLGSHIAAQHVQLNGFFLSGDGGAEGVFVAGAGNVGVGTNTPNANSILDVNGSGAMSALIVPRDAQAARPTGVNGMIRYNTNTARMEIFENGGWTDVVQTFTDTGIVTLTGENGLVVSGPATAKTLSIDTGVTAGQIVQVDVGDMLPVIDGSNLTNISNLRGVNVSTTAPTVGQVLRHNGSAWEAFTPVDNAGVTFVAMGSGLIGGNITATGTVTVDVGIGPNQIPQLNANGFLGIGTASVTTGAVADFWGASNLDSAMVLPRATTANRPTTGVDGMIRYNTTLAKFEVYENGNWYNMATGTGADNLGNHIATTNLRMGANWISSDGDSEGVRVAATGNVEISGTTGDVATINGTDNTTLKIATPGGSTAGPSLRLENSQAGAHTYQIYSTGSANGPGAGYLEFRDITNSTSPMVISPIGNVGIGSISPNVGAILDLNGTGNMSSLLVPRGSIAERAAIAANGMLRYNTNLAAFEVYGNNSWQQLATSATSGATDIDGLSDAIYNSTAESLYMGSGTGAGQNDARVRNTAIGFQSLSSINNDTADSNTAIGWRALNANTSASSNTAVGAEAQLNGTTGWANTAVGMTALMRNTAGSWNTAIGDGAAQQITGADNTAVGRSALIGNWMASGDAWGNVAIGVGVMQGTESADGNTSVGTRSLQAITNGNNNIVYGYQAADNITTGSNNMIIGFDIDAPSATASNQMSIGNMIFGTGIGTGTGTTIANGRIGIASNAPQAVLDVVGTGSASALIVPRDTTAARDGVGVNGMLRYNTNLAAFEVYQNNGWATLSTSASGASQWTTVAGNEIHYSTANVGIGTTNPDEILHLQSSAPRLKIKSTDANNAAGIDLMNNADSKMYIGLSGSGGSWPSPKVFSISPGPPNDNIPFLFGTNNGWRFAIDPSGNVGLGGSITNAADITAAGLVATTIGAIGVGTNAPNAGSVLEIRGTGNMSSMLIPRGSTAERAVAAANGMLRYNTNISQFEVYQNNAWATVSTSASAGDNLGNHTATQAILAVTGTAATPSIAFTGDTDTGVWSAGADRLALSTAGTGRMHIDPLGRVGIGTNDPVARLSVHGGNLWLGDSATPELQIVGNNSGTSTAYVNFFGRQTGYQGQIAAFGFYNWNGGAQYVGAFEMVRGQGGDNEGDMRFSTRAQADGGVSPRLTITGPGQVGIGTTSPNAGSILDLNGTGNLSSLLVPRGSTAERAATAANGMLRYNTNLAAFEVYANNNWATLATGSAGASQWTTVAGNEIHYSTANVGIGTNDPTEVLDVNGSMNIASGAYYKIGGEFALGTTGSTLEVGLGNNLSTIAFNASGSVDMIITGGKAGIGTTSPNAGAILDLNGTGNLSSLLVPRGTTAQRAATAANGMIRYNTNLAAFEVYANNQWSTVATSATSGATDLNGLSDVIIDATDFSYYIGSSSGLSAGVATNNTGVGHKALEGITTGGSNTAMGYRALDASTIGDSNTAIGAYALYVNATGINNTAIGTSALADSSGGDNTAVGEGAMEDLTSGDYNVALGRGAASGVEATTVANNNVIIGYYAGDVITSADNNILLGYRTGNTLTSGDNNLLIGHDIDAPSDTGAYQMSIGNMIFGTGVGTGTGTTISGGRIGIASNAPQAVLDVVGTGSASALIVPRDTTAARAGVGVNGMIRYNTNLAAFEVYANNQWATVATGSAGADNLGNHTATSAILAVTGTAATPSYTFANDTNTGLFSAGVDRLALATNGVERMRVTDNGSVGIGTAAPLVNLHVSGSSGILVSDPGTQATVGLDYAADGVVEWAMRTNGEDFQIIEPQLGNNLAYQITNFNTPEFFTHDFFTAPGVSSFTIDKSGRVGVGTTTPTAGSILDIRGTGVNFSSLLVPRDTTANRPTTAQNGMIRYNTNLAAFEVYANDQWATVATGAGGGSQWTTVAGNEIHYSTANVGIGTNNPGELLHIHANGGTPTLRIDNSAANGDSQIQFYENGFASFTMQNEGGANQLQIYTSDSVVNPIFALERTHGQLTLLGEGTNDSVLRFYDLNNYWSMGRDDSNSSNFSISYGAALGTNERLTINTMGGVGLGTTNANVGSILDINGTGNMSAVILPRGTTAERAATPANGMIRYNTATSKFEVYAISWQDLAMGAGGGGGTPGGADTQIQFNGGGAFAGSANLTWNNSAGWLGIGSATPAFPLDLVSSFASSTIFKVQNNAVDGYSGIEFRDNSSAYKGTISWANASAPVGASSFVFGSTSSDPLALWTNSIERMRISATGAVGIGTNNPSYTLSLSGSGGQTIGMEIHPSATTAGSGLTVLAGGASGGTNRTGGDLTLSGGRSTGNVGSNIQFQTATPGTSGTTVRNPSTKMVITGAGAVGIDFVNPTQPLTVEMDDGQGVVLRNRHATDGDGSYSTLFFNLGDNTVSDNLFNKGAIIFENSDTWARGKMHFAVNNLADDTNAGIAEARITIDTTGNVGIGTTTPGEALDVNGKVQATNFVVSSDAKFKRDIVPVSDALAKLSQIRGVNYYWRQSEFPGKQFTAEKQYGVIAQEVREVFPDLVYESNGALAVNYQGLIAPVIEAVKDLDNKCSMSEAQSQQLAAQVASNTRDIASLKKENDELKKKLEAQQGQINWLIEQIKKK